MHTIGDIALPVRRRIWLKQFGKHGSDLARRARGIDDRPVVTTHTIKSISQEVTFPRDVSDRATAAVTDTPFPGGAGRDGVCGLRGRAGSLFRVKMRQARFHHVEPTGHAGSTDRRGQRDLCGSGCSFLMSMWKTGESVRLLGLGVSRLGSPVRQLSLWGSRYERMSRLHSAIDSLRDKFDERIVKRGTELLDDDAEALIAAALKLSDRSEQRRCCEELLRLSVNR